MHNRTTQAVPTLEEMDRTASAMSAIVGYAGMLLALSAALALWGLRRSSRVTPYIGGHMWTRLCVYALVLGALYPVAALNRIVIERPGDHALVPISMVALNALVWCTVLAEWVAWFTKYDGNPPNWDIYHLFHRATTLCVVVIALGGVSSENVRFVNLLAVLVLVVALGWAATAEAAPTRSLLVPPLSATSIRAEMTRPRIVAGTFVMVAAASFVFEMLGPSYGNVVGIGVAALFMLLEHTMLAVPLLLMATAIDTPAAVRTAVSPPRLRESPPPPVVQTVIDDTVSDVLVAPLPTVVSFADWANE